MLTNRQELFDELFKDKFEEIEKIFGEIESSNKKDKEKIFVVTQMDSTTGQDKIVKIKAKTPEEAQKIYIKNQTVFAVTLDEWNETQDMFIRDNDNYPDDNALTDFRDFLIKSKKEVNEAKVYNEHIKASDLFYDTKEFEKSN